MRLLHTKTQELKSFDGAPPPYAILSHTWGDEEVTFSDLARPTREETAGWAKVERCCRRAAADGWEYCWIDTCCIDKSNPTELGEAINSMFRWYEEAEICYAFLADVPRLATFHKELNVSDCPFWWHFRSSRWFRRGWTLQELLAPTFLLFLDSYWEDIGSRDELAQQIEQATSIRSFQLTDFKDCSVATKISWAAHRETTRPEDRAYSLLGLLGVNLPLIYGEGDKAFTRLQQELIRNYDDETIFAWGDRPGQGHVLSVGSQAGILATSPEDFQHSNGIQMRSFDARRHGYTMNNAGLSISTEVFKYPGRWSGDIPIYAIKLNCTSQPFSSRSDPIVLFLHSSDTELVVFGRAGRVFRNWNDVSSIKWTNLGRKNIIVSHHASKRREKPAVSQRVRFEAPGIFRRGKPILATLDATTSRWTISACPDPALISLEGSSFLVIPCQGQTRAMLNTHVFVFVKSARGIPQFGIVVSAKYLTMKNFLHSHVSQLITRNERFPKTSSLPQGGIIRITLRPFHPLDAHSTVPADAVKYFRLKLRMGTIKPLGSSMNPAIGRFTYPKLEKKAGEPSEDYMYEPNFPSQISRLPDLKDMCLYDLLHDDFIRDRGSEDRAALNSWKRIRGNMTHLAVLRLARQITLNAMKRIGPLSPPVAGREPEIAQWRQFYLESSDISIQSGWSGGQRAVDPVIKISPNFMLGMKPQLTGFLMTNTHWVPPIHSLGVLLWSLGQKRVIKLMYPMQPLLMACPGVFGDQYDTMMKRLIVVQDEPEDITYVGVHMMEMALRELIDQWVCSGHGSNPYFTQHT